MPVDFGLPRLRVVELLIVVLKWVEPGPRSGTYFPSIPNKLELGVALRSDLGVLPLSRGHYGGGREGEVDFVFVLEAVAPGILEYMAWLVFLKLGTAAGFIIKDRGMLMLSMAKGGPSHRAAGPA
jgi:hypothetical protein